MKIGEADVSSKSKVIGQAQFAVYETMDEVLNHPQHGLGEAQALALLNAQVKTNAMNEVRAAKTKGPTKEWLKSEAWSEIVEEMVEQGLHSEARGNKPAMQALVDKRAAEIAERMKAAPEPVAVGADDEDEEE